MKKANPKPIVKRKYTKKAAVIAPPSPCIFPSDVTVLRSGQIVWIMVYLTSDILLKIGVIAWLMMALDPLGLL